MTKCYAYEMHEKDRDHIFTYDALILDMIRVYRKRKGLGEI